MTSGAPSPVMRAQRRADTSLLLARVLLAHGLGSTDVERCTGVPRQHVAEWLDPDAARAMPLADATALPERTRCVIAEHIAGPGHAVIALPDAAPDEGDDLVSLAELQRSSSALITETLLALADGTIDASEADRIESAIATQLRVMLRLRERMRAVQIERVVPIARAARASR